MQNLVIDSHTVCTKLWGRWTRWDKGVAYPLETCYSIFVITPNLVALGQTV